VIANLTKRVGPLRRCFKGRADGAFTLVEMLVAVGMGAMLVVGAAGVFSLASQAVGSSQANTEINNKLRILHSWLDRDFGRIRLDGPLMIMPREINLSDGSWARVDRIAFLASGDFASMTEPGVRAALAWIYYGQDDEVNFLPGTPTPEEMSGLALTREAMLLVGDGTPGVDLVALSFADMVHTWFRSSPPTGLEIWSGIPRPIMDVTDPNAKLYTQMLSNVVSFGVVRYYR